MAIIEHAVFYSNPMYNVSHSHTSCEIMYIVSGSLEIKVKGKTYNVNENDCVMIKSRQHHEIKVDKSKEYKRYITVINPWEIKKELVRPDLFAMLTDSSGEGVIHLENRPELLGDFERMADIFANGGSIYESLSTVLCILSCHYNKIKPENKTKTKHRPELLTEKVIEYIDNNFADNIKIDDIAKENFVSSGYLTHTFKSHTGMSPREYLTHIRCTRAYELITQTSMKFTEISLVTGFCCANDMSRKIREYYGKTPTAIRYEKA